VPPDLDRKGILSKSSKMWNTVFKRVVKFRDSKYVKKFKHTWGRNSSLVAKVSFMSFSDSGIWLIYLISAL